MNWLAGQPDTLFLGQGVGCGGTRLSADFSDIPADRRLEMPVAEELQLGISIGLSLEGVVPVSVFPRLNFLLRAADQLVNHLDAMPDFSDYRPRVIVRAAVGAKTPLDAGPQHTGDAPATALEVMLRNTVVDEVRNPDLVPAAYRAAYESGRSVVVVEHPW